MTFLPGHVGNRYTCQKNTVPKLRFDIVNLEHIACVKYYRNKNTNTLYFPTATWYKQVGIRNNITNV